MIRVLLVEDDKAVVNAASRILREAGYEVDTTDSGGDALCKLQTQPPPSMVILDLKIRGLSGHAILQSPGQTFPPILVTTGDALTLEDFSTGRVKKVLHKPYGMDELLNAVKEVLT